MATVSEMFALALRCHQAGHLQPAEQLYRQILQIDSSHAATYQRLGVLAGQLGQFDVAVASIRQALALKPGVSSWHFNMGVAFMCQGKLEETLACYDEALRLNPNNIEARWNRAALFLLLGDFERGWHEYEFGQVERGLHWRSLPQPLWDGSPLQGRTILLHAEQGLGDNLQFIRYVPLVKHRGGGKGVRHLLPERPEGCFAQKVPDPFSTASGQVIVECRPQLLRLLADFPGADLLTTSGSPLPAFDVRAPLASLPGIFQTRLESIPAAVPYLHADAELVEKWRRWLAASVSDRTGKQGFKIGIAWQGNPGHVNDRERSMPLAHFAPLGQVEGVDLLSLQIGPGVEQLASFAQQFCITNVGSHFNPSCLSDAAAVLMSLDLVVTVDTALAHLAGALAVPVWVMLPFIPEWRWLWQREDSPWYPTMRLFRQRRAGDWAAVMQRIAGEVRKQAGGG